MKTLTIKQPYASLIVNNHKKYEFRSWKTNYRGKILIHAGLSKDKNINKFDNYNLDYIYGAIIGEAEIIDCILVDEVFNNKLCKEDKIIYGSDHIDEYAWKLENIKKYDKPIYVKGKLGLWNYDLHE
ncbi:MAG: ASCH domain-containing protein [Bacilli bacterium]|nr:ASCH domain-containing protein [Bacilli bacterium]